MADIFWVCFVSSYYSGMHITVFFRKTLFAVHKLLFSPAKYYIFSNFFKRLSYCLFICECRDKKYTVFELEISENKKAKKRKKERRENRENLPTA